MPNTPALLLEQEPEPVTLKIVAWLLVTAQLTERPKNPTDIFCNLIFIHTIGIWSDGGSEESFSAHSYDLILTNLVELTYPNA